MDKPTKTILIDSEVAINPQGKLVSRPVMKTLSKGRWTEIVDYLEDIIILSNGEVIDSNDYKIISIEEIEI